MATPGWQGVTLTEIAQMQRARTVPSRPAPARAQKYRAEPCIVTADGTLFTTTEIHTAEAATKNPLVGTGTLAERAVRCGIVGQWFASTKEGKRFLELRALERSGTITELRLQAPFDLTVVSTTDGQARAIGKWIADFVYRRDGALVTEDTKGCKTPLYLRSKKHFQAQYGLPILET